MNRTRQPVYLLITLLFAAGLVLHLACSRRPDRPAPTTMDEFLSWEGMDGGVALAVQAAVREALDKGVHVRACRVHFHAEPEGFVVSFMNRDPDGTWRGCPPGPCDCLAVNIARDDLRVLGSHGVK